MAFTGKCTFTSNLSEVAEDISDLVSILAPHETPLLDILGDAPRPATSTYHQWMEDSLVANTDVINDATLNDTAKTTVTFAIMTPGLYRVGDLIQQVDQREVMMVTAIDTANNKITVTRGYGGTTKVSLVSNNLINIIGNAALEGQEAGASRYTVRTRAGNYTQIFTAPIQVSGTELAVRQVAVADELDYQKTLRLRELLRDLENTVINGVASESSPGGSATVRRSMRGIIKTIQTNGYYTGDPFLPSGNTLTEEMLNAMLRLLWEYTGSKVDMIVCGGAQKRKINSFIASSQRFQVTGETYKNLVSAYESDYGICRVVLSRYVPSNTILLLDSSRISVVPLAGRSFHYRPLAATGDYVSGEVIGEYTVEVRNEAAHGFLTNLSV